MCYNENEKCERDGLLSLSLASWICNLLMVIGLFSWVTPHCTLPHGEILSQTEAGIGLFLRYWSIMHRRCWRTRWVLCLFADLHVVTVVVTAIHLQWKSKPWEKSGLHLLFLWLYHVAHTPLEAFSICQIFKWRWTTCIGEKKAWKLNPGVLFAWQADIQLARTYFLLDTLRRRKTLVRQCQNMQVMIWSILSRVCIDSIYCCKENI